MGKGNDGLEGKSRQHAASQIQGEGKKSDRPGTAGWLQAGMSYCCHSFDSYVVKRAAGELGGGDPIVIPLPVINLIHRAS